MIGNTNRQYGDLIIVNGTSSAGKSTTVKALQSLMTAPYLHSGPDHFVHQYHSRLFTWREDREPKPFNGWLITVEGNVMVDAEIGPLGRQILASVYEAIAVFVGNGLNVIVEDALWRPEVLQTAVSTLHPFNPLFVGLHIPLKVAKQREIERGNRFLGGAVTFYARVHAHTIYDLEIDSGQHSAEECAEMIKAAAENGRSRTAFQQLADLFAKENRRDAAQPEDEGELVGQFAKLPSDLANWTTLTKEAE
ncbi:MAG: hypothetical protein AAF614_02965 [Chloroflexota bacterium]